MQRLVAGGKLEYRDSLQYSDHCTQQEHPALLRNRSLGECDLDLDLVLDLTQ